MVQRRILKDLTIFLPSSLSIRHVPFTPSFPTEADTALHSMRSICLFWIENPSAVAECTPRLTQAKVTLILLLLVLAAFISRTVQRRRRRNATVLAGLTTGAYGPSTGLRGKFDRLSASKPVLWESHIAPVNEDAKGWADIFVRAPHSNLPTSSRLVYLRAEGVSFLVSLWRVQRWCLSKRRRWMM